MSDHRLNRRRAGDAAGVLLLPVEHAAARLAGVAELLPAGVAAALDDDGRLAASSKQAYKYALQEFYAWRGERIFSLATVELYVGAMRKRELSVATINKALAAVRWLARHWSRQALDDVSLSSVQREQVARQAERVADVPALRNPNAELLAGRHVKLGEFDRLMDACIADKTPAGARDGAMLMLAWSTGMRMGELLALSMASIARREGYVELAIVGKGGKHRTNYIALDDGVAWALADWLDARGDADGALFAPINKGGTVELRHMSRQALQQTLQRRVAAAGLRAATTWHDFRRTFIGNRWSDKWDAATLSRYVGHASSAQTVRYDRRPEDARRDAALSLSFDYAGRNN